MSAESEIQTEAMRYARRAGFMVKRNFMGPGVATGWPDVEFFAPGGKMFFIEFKPPGGKTSPRQRYVIRLLVELHHEVYVCDDLESAKGIIDAHR